MTDLRRLAFEGSTIATLLVSLDGQDHGLVVDANPAATELFGEHLAGRSLTELLGHERPLTARTAAAGQFETQIGLRRLEAHFVELADGRPTLLVQLVDVTARVARERELAYRAEHDPLTGTLNRTGIENALQRLLGEPYDVQRPGALFFCDLNRFKEVNDEYGHLVGDRVMRRIADRIASTVRRTDPVGRYGGDEFLVLLPRIRPADAEETAARLVRIVEQPVEVEAHVASVGICIGVVVLDGVSTMHDVLAEADAAMYEAKAGDGSDRYVVRRLRPAQRSTQSPQSPPPGTR